MNRVQTACYCLLASAFIIGALVLVQSNRLIDTRAHAEMLVNKGFVTMVSTQSFQQDAELVYVLESKSEVLMVYTLDPNRRIIELLPGGALHLGRAFEMAIGNQPAGPAGAPKRAR